MGLLYVFVVSCHRLQVSDCSTFRIMCDVPSTAVLCRESIEFFTGMATKFFRKPFVVILVDSVIAGIIIHFMFHIRCISIHKHLYFSFCSATFARHFCPREVPHLSVCMLSLFCFNYYIWLICCNFSVCVYCLIPQHCNIFLFMHWPACVYVCVHRFPVVLMPRALHIE